MKAMYYTYQQMQEALREWSDQYPHLMKVVSIGASRDGRDMPAVILTNAQTGSDDQKSAVFIDANIHAGEVATNAVAMYWMQWSMEQHGHDPEATELLDQHTVYIVPRIAVDGAELYLTTPARFRSSGHLYPYSEPRDGFIEEDMNDDGKILQMRVPSPDGAFVIDEVDPRVMRPRQPGEIGGQYYHVFPEGRIDRVAKTGALPALAQSGSARRYGMDFNRNFPIRWAGESGQSGAGTMPLSEPELRNLADFIVAHPNIAAYAALHTSGGVILRQPSTGDDTVLSETDRHLFTRVADMGAKVSGYFAGSNFHKFATGHEKVLMPGAGDDWMYDHLGVLSFTVEIWNLAGRAGARGYGEIGMRRMMDLTPEEHTEDHRKMVAWAHKEVGDKGFIPWTPVVHPDFGRVEIGGLDPKYVIQNPPLHLLEEECVNISAFLTKLGLSAPKLTVASVEVTKEGPEVYRIVAQVCNGGYLPTSSTQKGKELTLQGVQAELDGSYEMISGRSPFAIGHLDGYGSQGSYHPPKSQSAYAEWVIQAPSASRLTVRFRGERSGSAQQGIILP
ncbi:MAG: M14 family metallopeptidase [Firmicutes bacterium]|nr:M14 family metallopeptidase [Bacillota bacterium]